GQGRRRGVARSGPGGCRRGRGAGHGNLGDEETGPPGRTGRCPGDRCMVEEAVPPVPSLDSTGGPTSRGGTDRERDYANRCPGHKNKCPRLAPLCQGPDERSRSAWAATSCLV